MPEFLEGISKIDKLKNVIANLVYNIIGENQIYDLVELESVTLNRPSKAVISFMPQMLRFQLNLCQMNFEN